MIAANLERDPLSPPINRLGDLLDICDDLQAQADAEVDPNITERMAGLVNEMRTGVIGFGRLMGVVLVDGDKYDMVDVSAGSGVPSELAVGVMHLVEHVGREVPEHELDEHIGEEKSVDLAVALLKALADRRHPLHRVAWRTTYNVENDTWELKKEFRDEGSVFIGEKKRPLAKLQGIVEPPEGSEVLLDSAQLPLARVLLHRKGSVTQRELKTLMGGAGDHLVMQVITSLDKTLRALGAGGVAQNDDQTVTYLEPWDVETSDSQD